MKRYKIQVVIADEQMVSNVTPVIDETIKPNQVIICASDAMKEKADYLSNFYSEHKVMSGFFPLGNGYDFNELQERFFELAASFESIKESVVINLSGGNKLVTIAAQTAFADNGFDCFYVIPERDHIVMLNNDDKSCYDIQDSIKLNHFFEIHGYNVSSIKRDLTITHSSRELFEELLKDADTHRESLGALNYMAAKAEDERSLTVRGRISPSACTIFSLFYQHGAIEYYDDSRVTFRSDADRAFCQGFWLEDYTYLKLSQLNKEIGLQDFACSVEIISPSGTKNEIDAVFLFNNNLYIIECKTARMNDKGSNVLYKIDTIKDYTGFHTTPIIMTMQSLSPFDRQRAKDLGITLFEGSTINSFTKQMKAILEKAKPSLL